MDPISNGMEIFLELSKGFAGEPLTEIGGINRFFNALIANTKGWMIVDFLDTTNWDEVERFEIKSENRQLTLVWHDYRGIQESEIDKELRQIAFPASVYSLSLCVNSVVPIGSEKGVVFLINGYAKTTKEIRSLYQNGTEEFQLLDDSFFKKRVIRKLDGNWEVIDFHCTPIFSIVILPKNCFINSYHSEALLYLYNIGESLDRLSKILESVDDIEASDSDTICEKVNTVRRIFEFVLKIECCYRNIAINSNYSQMFLGKLVGLIKQNKNDVLDRHSLNSLVDQLNEFSHDSGKPVKKSEAKNAIVLVRSYTSELWREISREAERL